MCRHSVRLLYLCQGPLRRAKLVLHMRIPAGQQHNHARMQRICLGARDAQSICACSHGLLMSQGVLQKAAHHHESALLCACIVLCDKAVDLALIAACASSSTCATLSSLLQRSDSARTRLLLRWLLR